MVERIERIARVKGIEKEFARSFERKEGFNDGKRGQKKFADTLDRELAKEVRPANEAGKGVPNAYSLELSSYPTQSLFYAGGMDFTKLQNLLR